MSILFYRRPDYIAKAAGPMDQGQCQRYVDRTQKHKRAIPDELSFENVIQNKALPPCALQDFMDYLVYVSHDAENLQFWLWLEDYTKRFNALPKREQVLSPPWSEDESAPPLANALDPAMRASDKSTLNLLEYPVSFETRELPPTPPILPPKFDSSRPQFSRNSSRTPLSRSPSRSTHHSVSPSTAAEAFDNMSVRSFNTTRTTPKEIAEDANTQVGLKWQSFTIQPFRSEVNRIISHYVAPNSPRELNLSHKTRAAVLHALQHTTNPNAFDPVKQLVECTLRGQSHPNFIRWSICNGNKPRVIQVRLNGGLFVFFGFVIAISLTLSHVPRWWRVMAMIPWVLGITTLVAAFKGLCIIMHSSHCRALHPWEQYSDVSSVNSFDVDDEATLSSSDVYSMSRSKRGLSLDTFGTGNSFDHEPWVEKYKKKSLLRKIYDRKIRIQDEAVRMLQDKIVMQSQLWALIIAIPVTAVFVVLPKGNLY